MRGVKVRSRVHRDIFKIAVIFLSIGVLIMPISYLLRQRVGYQGNDDTQFIEDPFIVSDQLELRPPAKLSDNKTTSGLHRQKRTAQPNDLEFISNTEEFRKYVKLRETRVNPNDFDFIISGQAICKEPPYLLIVCLSKHFSIEERAVIRETWGNWSNDEILSELLPSLAFKVVFMLGGPGNSTVYKDIAQKESQHYGDIIMADFEDTYENLTRKLIMTLKWATDYCKGAKFLLKVDEDTFVHMPNLLNYLKSVQVSKRGVIIGHGEFKHPVLRSGTWALPYDVYPLAEYPPYVSGNAYVISGNIIPRLYTIAHYLPYVYIEDVFITGILREAIGAVIVHRAGFTWWTERAPRLCGFHNTQRISATNTDQQLMRRLWLSLHHNLTNCYDPSTLRKLEFANKFQQT